MEKSQLNVIVADNIRVLMFEANKLGITKEEIISIISDKGQYILIYQA